MTDKEQQKQMEEKISKETKIKAEPQQSEQVRSKSESDPKKEATKKTEARANGKNLQASRKHCQYICSFIKNKSIDKAIQDLEQVTKLKKPIPFKGETPHRKGKGIMSGRYPVKAAKLFIYLLKGLKGNSMHNKMELEKTRIVSASASWASRPMRKGGTQGKRTNIILVAKEEVV